MKRTTMQDNNLGERLWSVINGFRGYLQIHEIVSLVTGLIVLIQEDAQTNNGEFRSHIGNRNAETTVSEMKEYGIELEQKGVYPKGFFNNFAFEKIDLPDAIYLCDTFLHLWRIYDEMGAEDAGAGLLKGLLNYYSSLGGKSGAERFEPNFLRKLVCSLAEVTDGSTVYDPCMGVAGYIEQIHSMGYKDVKFTGSEINVDTYYLAYAVASLNRIQGYDFRHEDFLAYPIIDGSHMLKKFDRVITNPPFGVRMMDWEFERISNDLYGRFQYGVPGKGSTEWMFIEAAIAATNDNGKTIVVTSNGALFRSIEGKIRSRILSDSDILEAIIQLPSGLLMPYTSIPVSVLVFNKNKKSEMNGKVLSIDATQLVTRVEGRKSETILSDEAIAKIIEIYKCPENIDGLSSIFSVQEIAENDYNFDLVAIGKKVASMKKLEGFIPLNDVAVDVFRGVQIAPSVLKASLDKAGSHYLLNLSNIDGGKIVFSSDEEIIETINPEKKWIKNYEAQEGDLLVAARGSFKCAVVEKDLPKSIVSGNLIVIRLPRSYSPYVLKYYLESELGRELIGQIQSGVAAPIINAAALAELMIPQVERAKMNEYEEKIISYSEKYEQMKAEAEAFKLSAQRELNELLQLKND